MTHSRSLSRQARRFLYASTRSALPAAPAPAPLALTTINRRLLSTSTFQPEHVDLPELPSDRKTIVSKIISLCQDKSVDNYPNHAEALLRQLERDLPDDLAPILTYNFVMQCYSDESMPEKAQHLLDTMIQTPDQLSYGICLTAWVKAAQPNNAARLLRRMISSQQADIAAFNILLSHYAQTGMLTEAMALLQQMHECEYVKPDKITYTDMIRVLVKQGAVDQAVDIVEMMQCNQDPAVRPDVITYSAVIKGLAKATNMQDAPKIAFRMLSIMQRQHAETGDIRIRPDTVAYNTVISVLANAQKPLEAEQLLTNMIDNVGGNVPLPSVVSYATVLTAWKNDNNPERAEELLWKIQNPNIVCFATVLAAWAKQGNAVKAEALVRKMHQLYDEGNTDACPNAMVYTSLMEAWINSKDANAVQQTEQLLKAMKQIGGNLAPTIITYNTFIKAIEKSSLPDKATRAFGVLKQLLTSNDRRLRPTVRTFSAVLRTCFDSTSNPDDALRIAWDTFLELKANNVQADEYTYTSLLRVCAEHSPKGKRGHGLVYKFFKACCDDGMVSFMVLVNLKHACSNEHLMRLIGTTSINDKAILYKLPEAWRRNHSTKERKR